MLARSYLSAEDLGIDPRHREALVRLLGMMERDELQHVERVWKRKKSDPLPTVGFNMGVWDTARREKCHCGTVRCIGGWMIALSGVELPAEEVTPEMRSLFHMTDVDTVDMTDVTVEQGASALRNYLTTGEPRWDEVLA